jgi:hypothetical protein
VAALPAAHVERPRAIGAHVAERAPGGWQYGDEVRVNAALMRSAAVA